MDRDDGSDDGHDGGHRDDDGLIGDAGGSDKDDEAEVWLEPTVHEAAAEGKNCVDDDL